MKTLFEEAKIFSASALAQATIEFHDSHFIYRGSGRNQGGPKDFIPSGTSYSSHEEMALLFGRKITHLDLKGQKVLDLDLCAELPAGIYYDKMLSSEPQRAIKELRAMGFSGVRFDGSDEDPNIADDIGEPVYEYRMFPKT